MILQSAFPPQSLPHHSPEWSRTTQTLYGLSQRKQVFLKQATAGSAGLLGLSCMKSCLCICCFGALRDKGHLKFACSQSLSQLSQHKTKCEFHDYKLSFLYFFVSYFSQYFSRLIILALPFFLIPTQPPESSAVRDHHACLFHSWHFDL